MMESLTSYVRVEEFAFSRISRSTAWNDLLKFKVKIPEIKCIALSKTHCVLHQVCFYQGIREKTP